MRQKLTKTVVEGARKGSERQFIWDSGDGAIKGFGLKIMPSGHKVFIFQYRRGGRAAKTQRYTIGTLGPGLTVAAARERAQELERDISKGLDPIAEDRSTLEREEAEKAVQRAAQKGRVELVLADYLIRLGRRSKPLRSLPERKRIFKAEIVDADEKTGPWFGKLVGEVTRADVRDLLKRIIDRGSPYTAIQVLRALGPFFDYAISEDLRSDNPTDAIDLTDLGVVIEPRDRYLSAAELTKVYQATDKLDYPFNQVFKLLILTAQRRSEIAGMHRRELAAKTTSWVIPAARAKNRTKHVVHLSSQALATLKSLPKGVGNLLFSTTGRKPPSGFSRAKKAWDKESGVRKWRIHDLRRTFATLAVDELKIAPHVADAILNHKTGTIRGVARTYNHAKFLPERKSALNAWGNYVETLVTEKTANVVPITAGRR